jgi:hypothetical protein
MNKLDFIRTVEIDTTKPDTNADMLYLDTSVKCIKHFTKCYDKHNNICPFKDKQGTPEGCWHHVHIYLKQHEENKLW